MNNFVFRLIKLIFGLFLYSLGIVIGIKANIGYAPWDVFHVGLSKTTGMSIGTASILVGFIIVLLTVFLGEKFGLGTLLNMILIGVFLDWIMAMNMIPMASSFVMGLFFLVIGLIVVSFATYFYISSGFGAGPRDSLMVVVSRKLNLPIGLCRGCIELTVTIIGYFLGGLVGVGTAIYVVLIGFFIQTTFSLVHFDPKAIHHETLKDTFYSLTGKTSLPPEN